MDLRDIRRLFYPAILWLIKFICMTSNIRFEGRQKYELTKKKFGNVIFAFWHGRIFILSYVHRFERICALASPSKDGKIVSFVLKKLGYEIVEGSSYKRPVEATLEMIRKIENGYDLAFAVDGPRGPAFKVSPGVIYLAKIAKKPIIPLSASAKNKKILNSWDRHIIPFPFNDMVVVYGEPIFVDEKNNIQEKSKELEKVLKEITEKADSYF